MSDTTGWLERASRGEPEIIVLPNNEACAAAAAERIAGILAVAVNERGRADWATTGGSTPAGIYKHLSKAPLRDTVPWGRVNIWLGDERFVPRGDDWCNARIGDRELVGAAPGTALEQTTIHAWPVDEAMSLGEGGAWCAARYVEMMRESGVPFEDGSRERGVGRHSSGDCTGPHLGHPSRDRGRRLPRFTAQEFVGGGALYVDPQIEAVEQRPRDATVITRPAALGATTKARAAAEATGARIHRADE